MLHVTNGDTTSLDLYSEGFYLLYSNINIVHQFSMYNLIKGKVFSLK